jgi:hypothetical protein
MNYEHYDGYQDFSEGDKEEDEGQHYPCPEGICYAKLVL